MIGNQIQNYKIISLLGEGGMANVYLGEHLTLKGKVAIKFLKDEFVANKNIRKRFLAEARILHQLSHVNIIKVTDFIDAGDIVAFVMEYIEGDSLSEFIIKKGKLTDTDVEYIFPQMLSAVEYIHEKGLVHRDVKPSNFMMTKEGTIKLLDFGIAKNTNDGALDYTQTTATHMMGTPLYMSPEQMRNTSEVTKQTDIYSLGVVLWQMVMNKKPYNAENLSLVEIQIQIFQEPLALTKTIWDPFIQKATKKKAEDRYLNARLFLKSFNDFLLQKRKKQKIDDTVFDSESPIAHYLEATVIVGVDEKSVIIDDLEIMKIDFGNLNWEDAMKKFNSDKEKGWRLPSKEELSILYLNKEKIGGFTNYSYWSSNSYNEYIAVEKSFYNGKEGTTDKTQKCFVRAVRSIKVKIYDQSAYPKL